MIRPVIKKRLLFVLFKIIHRLMQQEKWILQMDGISHLPRS